MKFITRKAVLASATAVAVTFGGASIASAETSTSASATPTTSASATPTTSASATPTTTAAPVATTATATKTVTVAPTTTEKDGSSDVEPKDIKDWIGVATAIISGLGVLLAFLSKYFKLPF